jgi:predicted SnoaL-like aldol condensation-catalyzing enzyme
MATHKEIAIAFLQNAARGTLDDVVAQHIAPGFRHHNPHFPDDGPSLWAAMKENAKANPGKVLKVHHVLEDGDLVAIHSHVRHNPGERGYALVHIFRFNDSKIVELWDIAMEIPADSPNKAGMF